MAQDLMMILTPLVDETCSPNTLHPYFKKQLMSQKLESLDLNRGASLDEILLTVLKFCASELAPYRISQSFFMNFSQGEISICSE
ncbi:hypothetical protein J6590_014117 [Homalodisca vitripennis]|nr:hypothetical protein J6590_014117 [Homalodisca vitripennis]